MLIWTNAVFFLTNIISYTNKRIGMMFRLMLISMKMNRGNLSTSYSQLLYISIFKINITNKKALWIFQINAS